MSANDIVVLIYNVMTVLAIVALLYFIYTDLIKGRKK